MFYVYLYYDPRFSPPKPLYAGKGSKRRMYHHLTKKCKNPILKRKIAKIKEVGMLPIIEKIADNLDHEEAGGLEITLIEEYGRINIKTGTLCNLTNGGDGTIGYKHSEKTISLFSSQRKGKKQTEAQYRANCSRSPQTEETRIKRSLGNKGRKPSEKQRNMMRSQQYRAGVFKVILPNGEEAIIKNLSQFCRDMDLDRTTCTKSATSGIPYKGYKFYRI